ncbi:aminotransferase class I/II-fold pyridoxal phosphate-dependent enzyme [Hymenobacter sp. BT186]|uniref:Aminotransferase class I/II-fold pyridoxal phosphate-dependent enzyme n=1 Tax=Hymenobacter telluris TaxID=2816474 RepID=A0A939JBZ3_9BACT|nr:GntG family PLP-dependent aldolase [Hymenobacter telluris]MBO0359651.1 aminotransferase class I/II-fold pyridoxal phosphate-dependent enzyme [Hymenobacter telluris]MBW3375678.1 aminotransferase class I/II-fold pyridoxal phosphate-dependent enzyme [Hymenobacter norwichensis]
MMNPLIDLRSDTVTRPTPAMLEMMFQAPVGDDVYEEDPTVRALENEAAARFGLEAGLFCPSGTMTNQIAIKAHTEPLSEVICEQTSHIYLWEVGGIAFHSGASVALLAGERGRVTAAQVEAAIRPVNVHYPTTSLISLENTHNRGGGSCYALSELEAIAEVSRRHGIPLHLDGARIFNALVATGQQATEYGRLFDTISVCLSKGLGAPVGSVLLGSKAFIQKTKRIRKVMGGGMRQAGYLAAAGLYALENNVNRLADDHRRARQLGEQLAQQSYVAEVLPVETNLVIFRLKPEMPAEKFLAQLEEQGIKASSFGPQMIRFVTHLDVDDEMITRIEDALSAF